VYSSYFSFVSHCWDTENTLVRECQSLYHAIITDQQRGYFLLVGVAYQLQRLVWGRRVRVTDMEDQHPQRDITLQQSWCLYWKMKKMKMKD